MRGSSSSRAKSIVNEWHDAFSGECGLLRASGVADAGELLCVERARLKINSQCDQGSKRTANLN